MADDTPRPGFYALSYGARTWHLWLYPSGIENLKGKIKAAAGKPEGGWVDFDVVPEEAIELRKYGRDAKEPRPAHNVSVFVASGVPIVISTEIEPENDATDLV